MIETPILLLIFNRARLTRMVFDVIRLVKPRSLYVMADGPRTDRTDDVAKCAETRKVLDRVDWDCEVHTLFHDTNQGCGRAVVSGINWLFQNEDRGIILEDDCLPDPTFFSYCEELLERYQDDARIMHINGNNFNIGEFTDSQSSYCFGSYPQVWGWATWRRAWALYDRQLACWPKLKSGNRLDRMGWSFVEKRIQVEKFDYLFRNQPRDMWDYQWQLSVFNQNGITVVPSVNLISNIGFGIDATHTTKIREECSKLSTMPLRFPLKHPTHMLRDPVADNKYKKIMVGNIKTLSRVMIRKARVIADSAYRKLRGPHKDS